MKIVYCASEVAPLIKVGGLGDVAGSLPKALAGLGADISVVVPKYGDIDIRNYGISEMGEFEVEFDGKEEKVKIWETKLPGSKVPVYLLENGHYLSKGEHQAFAGTVSEIDRFAFFSKSIAQLLIPNSQLPISSFDLLHLNDWHTSLVPLLLPSNIHLPSLLTIHNISYQGLAPCNLLEKLGLNKERCRVLKWDAQNRDIDILMEGIIHADFVNTVSPTYAQEIKTPEFGWGIEEVLQGKEGRVVGILNGLDYEVWNPATDPHINFKFQISNFKLGKIENKKFLQKELGLEVNEKISLLAFIGRLEPKQKGLDILYEALEKLLPEKNFQLVMLSTGNEEWEEKFKVQSSKFKVNMKFIPRFDEKLAHQIYAAADMILVPSKFEPCGLPQMIAMRYGALPLVRKTGGLADTVRDNINGFVFDKYASIALIKTIQRAIEQWDNETMRWQMIEKAMQQDFSWDKSAKEYLELYKRILKITQ